MLLRQVKAAILATAFSFPCPFLMFPERATSPERTACSPSKLAKPAMSALSNSSAAEKSPSFTSYSPKRKMPPPPYSALAPGMTTLLFCAESGRRTWEKVCPLKSSSSELKTPLALKSFWVPFKVNEPPILPATGEEASTFFKSKATSSTERSSATGSSILLKSSLPLRRPFSPLAVKSRLTASTTFWWKDTLPFSTIGNFSS